MRSQSDNYFFVITGAPGAGKTTLINELKKRGYACVEEGARQIIQEQVSINGDAVPWNNLQQFKKLLLSHAIKTYRQAIGNSKEVTFFDRGVLDLIAYDRRTKTEHSKELQHAIQTILYSKKVFIAPPWEEIYCNDCERKQTYEEAVDVYNNIVEVYSEYGCELIEIPKASVESRTEFIIQLITKDAKKVGS